MNPTAGLPIADASERTGLTPDTLRYYERDGLMLHEVGRSATGTAATPRRTCAGSG